MIWVRVHFPMDGSALGDPISRLILRDLSARRGLGRLGRFRSASSLLEHRSLLSQEVRRINCEGTARSVAVTVAARC